MDIKQHVQQIVSQLTLEEKASLLSGRDTWSTREIRDLVPSIFMTDGPHGLRKSVEGFSGMPATCFPTASALASTWNTDLLYQVGEAIGAEAQAANVQVVLGPGVNMKRSPLGGRNFEYFSEDPVLSGEMAVAHIGGMKAQGVGASLKHYAANNQEYERFSNDSIVDERPLHEVYLRAFETTVRRAQPWSLMASYNLVNGEHASTNRYLLQTMLRDTWKHEGIVVSDWGAAAVDRVKGVEAGLHLEMPGGSDENTAAVIEAVNHGILSHKTLDTRVGQLVENILKVHNTKRENSSFSKEEHHQLAYQAASEAIVLLKNDNHTLPIADKYKKIALVGSFAREPRFQGGGSSQITPTKVDTLQDKLTAALSKTAKLDYVDGYRLRDGVATLALLKEAREAAEEADIVIVSVGLPASFEFEGYDRPQLGLPEGHNTLVEELVKVNKNVVVVLTNGSAVSMPWAGKVSAIIEGWLTGQAGAGAMADVLVGAINPSGKLSETFPKRIEDTSSFLDFPNKTGRSHYSEGIFIGYRWHDKRDIAPLFPFGYGLSYTSFRYSNLKISKTTLYDDESVIVTARVKNIGRVSGKEVAQMYISIHDDSEVHPVHELKKFTKVDLQPGEEQEVSWMLTPEDLSYYSEIEHRWRVAIGEITVAVGRSSRDLPLEESIEIQEREPRPIVITEHSMLKEFATHPRGRKFYDLIALQLGKQFAGTGDKQMTNLMTQLIGDMPIERLPGLSGGLMTHDFVDAVVAYCRHEDGIHPVESLGYYKELAKLGIRALGQKKKSKS
jgi:beta-glucosidase